MEAKIKTFLEDAITISTERYEIICAIRDAFLNANLGFTEGFKYGGITYNISNELIGGIYSYKEHVSIEFSHGVTFSDPHHILEGGGKHRRHIKIRSLSDIKEKLVVSFIQQSA
jgi:hypothetical protein